MLVLLLLQGSLVYLLKGPGSLEACGEPGCHLGLGHLQLIGRGDTPRTSRELHRTTLCQVHPLTAWPEYTTAMLNLRFMHGLVLKLALWRSCPSRQTARA